MKKRAASMLCFLLVISFLSACGKEQPEIQLEKAEQQRIPFEQDGFSITAEKKAYLPEEDEVTLILRNESDQEITYSKHFTLQKEVEGTWYAVPFKDGAAFIEIALKIPPGKTVAETIPLYLFERPLSEGNYRVVKQINGSSMAAEFLIAD